MPRQRATAPSCGWLRASPLDGQGHALLLLREAQEVGVGVENEGIQGSSVDQLPGEPTPNRLGRLSRPLLVQVVQLTGDARCGPGVDAAVEVRDGDLVLHEARDEVQGSAVVGERRQDSGLLVGEALPHVLQNRGDAVGGSPTEF